MPSSFVSLGLYDGVVFSHLYPTFPRELGIPHRILVSSKREMLNTIREFNGKTDIYASVYSFPIIMVDKLFYDFDGPSALKEASKFYEFLLDKDLTVIPVHSGKRGIHLYVLLRPSLPNKTVLMTVMRNLVTECFGEDGTESIDSHTFGNLRQLARVPNTLRPGLGTFCTPLPLNWTDMSKEQILDYIKSPHEGQVEPRKFPELTDLSPVDNLEVKEEKVKGFTFFRLSVDMRFFKDILRPCLWNRILEPNPSHTVRVATTIDLLNSGVSPEQILQFYSTLGWRDFDVKDTKYQIDQIVRKKYHSYSCKRLRELKIPTRGCCLG
jgi:hypothetical protein